MIKTENLSMLFTTEDVQTKALNEVSLEIKKRRICGYHGAFGLRQIHLAEYPGNA